MKKMNSLTLNGTTYNRFAGDVESVNGQTGAVVLNAEDVGALPDTTQIPTVPSALPNPNKLTFTGAVSAEYDGSTAVSVEIPSGGGQAIDKIAIKITETVHSISLLDNITLYNRIRANIKVVGDSANAEAGILGATTPSGLLINYLLNATKTATGYLFFDLRLSEQGAESDIVPRFANYAYNAGDLSHVYGMDRTRWTGALSLLPNAADWNFGAGTEIYLEAYRA